MAKVKLTIMKGVMSGYSVYINGRLIAGKKPFSAPSTSSIIDFDVEDAVIRGALPGVPTKPSPPTPPTHKTSRK